MLGVMGFLGVLRWASSLEGIFFALVGLLFALGGLLMREPEDVRTTIEGLGVLLVVVYAGLAILGLFTPFQDAQVWGMYELVFLLLGVLSIVASRVLRDAER